MKNRAEVLGHLMKTRGNSDNLPISDYHRLIVGPEMVRRHMRLSEPLTEPKWCDWCEVFRHTPVHLAKVDGRHRLGSGWANMCMLHWEEYGCGTLGLGSGQELHYTPEVLKAVQEQLQLQLGINSSLPEREFISHFLAAGGKHHSMLPFAFRVQCWEAADGLGTQRINQIVTINGGWDWSHIRDSTDKAVLEITVLICDFFRIPDYTTWSPNPMDRQAVREAAEKKVLDFSDLEDLMEGFDEE